MNNFILRLFCAITFLYNVALSYKLKEVELPNDLSDVKIFSKADIAEFDGSDPDLPIYMAVKGVVFDVTSGKKFYGPGTSYHALVGKDCTRAVAKWSLDAEDMSPDVSDLAESNLKGLDEVFEKTYAAKYPIAGYMDYLVENAREQRNIEL